MIVPAVGLGVPPGRRADRGSCDAELLVLALMRRAPRPGPHRAAAVVAGDWRDGRRRLAGLVVPS